MYFDRKRVRQKQAEWRQAQRDQRTDEQQLAKLERNGHGECREADRLRERINLTSVPCAVECHCEGQHDYAADPDGKGN